MRPQARSGTGRLDPRSFLSLPWIVSQRGAVAAPGLTKTLTAKNRPSAVGNEPKTNARRPCMITQRLGAEEGDTPVEQQPAAMQDFDRILKGEKPGDSVGNGLRGTPGQIFPPDFPPNSSLQ